MRNLKTVNYDEMFTLSAPSPKWVWNAQGQLVEIPAGQPAWDHDPVTGESLGQRLEDEVTNGHPNGKLNIAVADYTITDPSDPFMPDAKVLTDDVGHPDDPLHTGLGNVYPWGAAGGTLQALRVVYVKEGMSRFVSLRAASGPRGFSFDLVNQEVVPGSVSEGVTPRAKKLSGGWWELSFLSGWGSASGNQYWFSFGNILSGNYTITSEIGDQITLAYPSMFDTDDPAPPNPIPTDGASVARAADVLDAETIAGGVGRGTILVRCQLTEGAPVLAFDGTALVAAPDADWHTYVISYDDTETLISIDGADATTGAGITPSLPLNVFRDSSSAGSGYIEDLVFSPIKKTAAQVKAASAAGEL